MDNQEPNVHEGDEKPTLPEELTELDKEVTQREEATQKTEDFVARKREELQKRREAIIERQKKAQAEAKKVKREFRKENDEAGSDSQNNENSNEPETDSNSQIDDEEARFNRFKERLKAEQEQEHLQQQVDSLVEKYPEAEADQLVKVEKLVPELKTHFSDLSTDELMKKAIYLVLGDIDSSDSINPTVDVSGTNPSGSVQRSTRTSYKYEILPSHRKAVKGMGMTEESYLQMLERRDKAGDDISKYGGRKIN